MITSSPWLGNGGCKEEKRMASYVEVNFVTKNPTKTTLKKRSDLLLSKKNDEMK